MALNGSVVYPFTLTVLVISDSIYEHSSRSQGRPRNKARETGRALIKMQYCVCFCLTACVPIVAHSNKSRTGGKESLEMRLVLTLN